MADHVTTREFNMLEATRRMADKEDAIHIRGSMALKMAERLQHNARMALRYYLELLSIKHLKKRWEDGLELAAWKAVLHGSNTLSVEEVQNLREMSEEAGGWWRVPAETDEPEFIATADWKIEYEEWEQV